MSFPLERSAIDDAVARLQFRTQAFIDGRFQAAVSGETFSTENPATGKPLAQVAAGDAADVDLAVRAARRAFERGTWSRLSPMNRKKVLLAFADRAGEPGTDLDAVRMRGPGATAWVSPEWGKPSQNEAALRSRGALIPCPPASPTRPA